jgi:peptidoglycan/LPS O-acetylase OafA/YrhL
LASLTTWWTQAAETPSVARVATRFYHPELDILRFFAFFGVFCHHALPHDPGFYTAFGIPFPIATTLSAIGATGAFGVDLFFALSAYLITELLLREKELIGTVDLRSFYIRRILRIWPLYFSFLALAIGMQFFVQGQQLGWRATAAFTFLAGNWWIAFRGFPQSIVFPLWSVSIEEQFYILWPAAARRVRTSTMAGIAVGMLIVASVSRFYLAQNLATETQVWCNTLARLDPIAAGILLAIVLRGAAPNWKFAARLALLVSGICCMVTAALICSVKFDPITTTRIMLGYPLIAIGAVAILLSVISSSAPLSKSAFVYLGRISYGLYVFHILGLMLSDYVVPRGYSSFSFYLLKISVALAITILLSAASFRWLEQPFLRLKRRFTHVVSRVDA